jgi:hypothetical protein
LDGGSVSVGADKVCGVDGLQRRAPGDRPALGSLFFRVICYRS